MMDAQDRATGHVQVKLDWNGRTRAFWAYWRDAEGRRRGKRLGSAHVRDAGRRTARGAIVWRAGHGPKPSPEYLTPQEAEERLREILDAMRVSTGETGSDEAQRSLQDASEGWLAERRGEKGLKRSTVEGYEDMFERLYRDLGAETPVRDLADGRLRPYFAEFKSMRVLGAKAAEEARGEGKEVRRVIVERWTAQPPGSQAIEVPSKAQAEQLAAELPGTWKHRRRGAYRVVPLNAQRPRRVSRATANQLRGEGWLVERRRTPRWMLVEPAAAQTRNAYRDILGAILDYAVRERWIEVNPLDAVKRASKRRERQRILRRDDFYDPQEVARLLEHAPSVVEEAFWLCGAHAGFRLPGEALGLRWGAVDFQAGVIRPYDNWVRNAPDSTKTSDSEPIPMTPRLTNALAALKQRARATGDEDFVFASELEDSPISDRPLREAFKEAQRKAGLKPIRMYNLRHSFGTTLARDGVDVRTIQALMRHDRLSTTEQYMAYRPRPQLAGQLAKALEPTQAQAAAPQALLPAASIAPALLEKLEEHIPAKWLREMQRICTEATTPIPA